MFEQSALPLVVSDKGDRQQLSDFGTGEVDANVFKDDSEAFAFLMIIATRDLCNIEDSGTTVLLVSNTNKRQISCCIATWPRSPICMSIDVFNNAGTQ